MEYKLSDEVTAIKNVAIKFAREKLAPIAKEDYDKELFRREIVEEMSEIGFFGCLMPEKYGGTNLGYFAAVQIAEEISKVSASYGGTFVGQLAGPPVTILKYGTDEQKDKYISGIVSGRLLPLFASTEPDAGSDVAAMRSKAVENDNHFVINGVKTWITNATVADMGLFWVYTDTERKHKGISSFLVDMKVTPGITTRKIHKLGLVCSDAGEVVLEDVEIPKSSLLGQRGQGFEILMFTLGNTRIFAATRALGVSRACLEESLKYAKERIQFGKPIAEFQMIQSQLADMYVDIEASKTLIYQAAANKDRGINDLTEVATAKYFACEAGVRVALAAMKIFSSYGFSIEYPLQRYVRDAMAFPITEGTSNIQKLIIARSLLKGERS